MGRSPTPDEAGATNCTRNVSYNVGGLMMIRAMSNPMRVISTALMALLIGVAVSSAACKWEDNVGGTVENRTDSAVCFYLYPEDAAEGRCSGELKPHTTDDWFQECRDGPGADKIPITVILAVKEGGRLIYQRTEECRVWQASGGKFVIQQRGDNFVVTDPLADATPGP